MFRRSRPRRRSSAPLLVSIAAHAVVFAVFVQALVMRRPIFDVFGRAPAAKERVQRVRYVTLARPGGAPTIPTPPPAAGRGGGNGRQRPVTPYVVPPVVPSVIPAPSRTATPDDESGTGPLLGGGKGPLRGVQPRYTDPKLWRPPDAIPPGRPGTVAERLDSLVVGDVRAYNDSLRAMAMARGRTPGDWTVEKGGQKYGIDSKYIHLGPFSIPTSLLAFLPINVSNSPSVAARNSEIARNREEILWQAQRAAYDADFNKAVRSIEERKNRERREALRMKAAADSARRLQSEVGKQ